MSNFVLLLQRSIFTTSGLLLTFAATVSLCPHCLAEDKPKIQPQIKIVSAKAAEIKTAGGTLQKVSPGEVLLITQSNQEWFWVPLLGGWIKQTDVREPEDLVQYLDKMLKTEPTAERYHLRGIAHQVLEHYEQALADFDASLKQNATNAAVYINRGNIRRLQGNYPQALADLDRAIQINANSANAWYIRGLIRFENQQTQDALSDFNEALKLNPKLVSALNARGITYRQLEQLEPALSDFNQAIKLNNFVSEVFSNRAALWEEKQQFDSAIKDYQRAIELNPTSATAHNDLAWLYATCPDTKFQNPKAAVMHAELACELTQSRDWNLLDTLATAYRENEQIDLAVKTLTKAVEIAPDQEKNDLQKKLKIFKKE